MSDVTELKAVFELCQPRQTETDRKISVGKLNSLFQQYVEKTPNFKHSERTDLEISSAVKMNFSDTWITFDEFANMVDDFTNSNNERRYCRQGEEGSSCRRLPEEDSLPDIPSKMSRSVQKCSPESLIRIHPPDDFGHRSNDSNKLLPYGLRDKISDSIENEDLERFDSRKETHFNSLFHFEDKTDLNFNEAHNGPKSLQQLKSRRTNKRGRSKQTEIRRSPRPRHLEVSMLDKRWDSRRHSDNKLFPSVGYSLSLNSSGRSSNCDEIEVHSDISIEDDVHELSQKVQVLSKRIGVLSEGQIEADERFSKVRQENWILRSKLDELVDEVRDLQMCSKEQVELEQKRSQELLEKLQREKQLEIENLTLRLKDMEDKNCNVVKEMQQMEITMERVKSEKRSLEDQLVTLEDDLQHTQEQNSQLKESLSKEYSKHESDVNASKLIIEELSKEVDSLKQQGSRGARTLLTISSVEDEDLAMEQSLTKELELELRSAKERVKALTDENEELRGQVLQCAHDKGRELLAIRNIKDISIGEEIMALSETEIRSEVRELREVNLQLKHYIEDILTKIIERYPQLLEVRK